MTTYETPGSSPLINANIDVPRLLRDLALTDPDMRLLAGLEIPSDIRVPSVSPIKTSTVTDVLRIIQPEREFDVVGGKAPSDVGELPLGQTTIDGSLNRLRNGTKIREQASPGEINSVAWFSPENGLFRVGEHATRIEIPRRVEGVIHTTEGADLSTQFDPTAEYEDRAVVAIRIPDYPTLVRISPSTEAVRFPQAAVLAAYDAEGGFDQHTAGSMLVKMGIVRDKQNPHTELTANRPGGPLPRQDQMARVMIRSLVQLAKGV
jgi:hypothetical protein